MTWKHFRVQAVDCLRAGAVLLAVWQMSGGGALLAQDATPQTASPIQHVILIIGREPYFRSHLRHLCTSAGQYGLESSF